MARTRGPTVEGAGEGLVGRLPGFLQVPRQEQHCRDEARVLGPVPVLEPHVMVPRHHTIKSRTAAYRILYALFSPLYPLIKRLAPDSVTDTAKVGRAMINVAKNGYPKPILDPKDINILAG